MHAYIHKYMYAYIQIRAQRDSIATCPLGDMLSYGIFRQREADMVTGMYVCMYVCGFNVLRTCTTQIPSELCYWSGLEMILQ